MKELTKKVVEAGLVPNQSIRLLKMWRCLPESVPECEAEEKTQEELMSFVKQIEALLDDEKGMVEMMETELDLDHTLRTNPHIIFAPLDGDTIEMTVGVTRSGQLIFPVGDGRVQERVCRRGNMIVKDDRSFIITHVEPRYMGELLKFYLCSIVQEDM